MLDDVRYALRGMLRSPGFTAVALLMIALGTGANAAMFSVIDGVMLQSPFTDPDRIGILRVMAPRGAVTAGISTPQYRSLAASPGPFEAVAAMGGGTRPMIAGLGEPRRFNDECVTAAMFRVLGTPPLLGRVFSDEDDRPGAAVVVVLSYDFWKRELGGAADVPGRSVTIDGRPATIIGVMPRRFAGPLSRNDNDGWLPLGPAFSAGMAHGPLSIGRIILLNALVGLPFGWLFWKYGLEHAMVAHFSADLVLHVGAQLALAALA